MADDDWEEEEPSEDTPDEAEPAEQAIPTKEEPYTPDETDQEEPDQEEPNQEEPAPEPAPRERGFMEAEAAEPEYPGAPAGGDRTLSDEEARRALKGYVADPNRTLSDEEAQRALQGDDNLGVTGNVKAFGKTLAEGVGNLPGSVAQWGAAGRNWWENDYDRNTSDIDPMTGREIPRERFEQEFPDPNRQITDLRKDPLYEWGKQWKEQGAGGSIPAMPFRALQKLGEIYGITGAEKQSVGGLAGDITANILPMLTPGLGVIGGAAVGAGSMAGQGYVNTYGQAMDKGVNPLTAREAAGASALVQGVGGMAVIPGFMAAGKAVGVLTEQLPFMVPNVVQRLMQGGVNMEGMTAFNEVLKAWDAEIAKQYYDPDAKYHFSIKEYFTSPENTANRLVFGALGALHRPSKADIQTEPDVKVNEGQPLKTGHSIAEEKQPLPTENVGDRFNKETGRKEGFDQEGSETRYPGKGGAPESKVNLSALKASKTKYEALINRNVPKVEGDALVDKTVSDVLAERVAEGKPMPETEAARPSSDTEAQARPLTPQEPQEPRPVGPQIPPENRAQFRWPQRPAEQGPKRSPLWDQQPERQAPMQVPPERLPRGVNQGPPAPPPVPPGFRGAQPTLPPKAAAVVRATKARQRPAQPPADVAAYNEAKPVTAAVTTREVPGLGKVAEKTEPVRYLGGSTKEPAPETPGKPAVVTSPNVPNEMVLHSPGKPDITINPHKYLDIHELKERMYMEKAAKERETGRRGAYAPSHVRATGQERIAFAKDGILSYFDNYQRQMTDLYHEVGKGPTAKDVFPVDREEAKSEQKPVMGPIEAREKGLVKEIPEPAKNASVSAESHKPAIIEKPAQKTAPKAEAAKAVSKAKEPAPEAPKAAEVKSKFKIADWKAKDKAERVKAALDRARAAGAEKAQAKREANVGEFNKEHPAPEYKGRKVLRDMDAERGQETVDWIDRAIRETDREDEANVLRAAKKYIQDEGNTGREAYIAATKRVRDALGLDSKPEEPAPETAPAPTKQTRAAGKAKIDEEYEAAAGNSKELREADAARKLARDQWDKVGDIGDKLAAALKGPAAAEKFIRETLQPLSRQYLEAGVGRKTRKRGANETDDNFAKRTWPEKFAGQVHHLANDIVKGERGKISPRMWKAVDGAEVKLQRFATTYFGLRMAERGGWDSDIAKTLAGNFDEAAKARTDSIMRAGDAPDAGNTGTAWDRFDRTPGTKTKIDDLFSGVDLRNPESTLRKLEALAARPGTEAEGKAARDAIDRIKASMGGKWTAEEPLRTVGEGFGRKAPGRETPEEHLDRIIREAKAEAADRDRRPFSGGREAFRGEDRMRPNRWWSGVDEGPTDFVTHVGDGIGTARAGKVRRLHDMLTETDFSGSRPLQMIAAKVMERVPNLRVYIIDDAAVGKYFGGHGRNPSNFAFYMGGLNHIVATERALQNPYHKPGEVILHEALHAATNNRVWTDSSFSKLGRKLINEVADAGRLYKGDDVFRVQDKLNYLQRNGPTEIAPVLLASPSMMNMLANNRLSKALSAELKLGGWKDPTLWDGIKAFFAKAIGLRPKEDTMNALEGVLRYTDKVFADNPSDQARGSAEIRKMYDMPEASGIDVERLKEKVPPRVSNFARSLRDAFSPTPMTVEGRKAEKYIREQGGFARRMSDIADEEFKPYHAEINAASEETKLGFMHHMEDPTNVPIPKATPKIQELADKLAGAFKAVRGALERLPITAGMEFIENYFPHMWKDLDAAKKFVSNWYAKNPQGSAGSLNKRNYPTIADGLAAGLELKFNNPLDAGLRYLQSMYAYVGFESARLKALENGDIQYFPKASIGASGNPDAARALPPDKYNWIPVKGRYMEQGRMQAYAHPDFANVWNNYLSKGVGELGPAMSDIYDGLRRFANATTAFQLGLNLYHGYTMTQEAFFNEAKSILPQLRNNPMGALKSTLLTGTIVGPAIARTASGALGRWRDPAKGTPLQQRAQSILQDAGAGLGRRHTPEYDMSTGQSLFTSYVQGSLGHEIRASLQELKNAGYIAGPLKLPFVAMHWAGRVLQTIAQPIFEEYIPRLKAGIAEKEVLRYLEQKDNASPDELYNYAKKQFDFIDNALGEMVQDNILMNQFLKQAAQVAAISYSWTMGTWRLMASVPRGAYRLATDPVDTLKSIVDLTHPKHDPNFAYAIVFPFAAAFFGLVQNYLHGEDPDKFSSYYYPYTGGLVKAGGSWVKQQFTPPGYTKDLGAYWADMTGHSKSPFEELKGKRKWWLKQAFDQMYGTDYFDHPFIRPNATWLESMADRALYAAQELEPISVKNMREQLGYGGPWAGPYHGPKKGDKITFPERAVGVREAPSYIENPEGTKAGIDRAYKRRYEEGVKFRERQRAIRE